MGYSNGLLESDEKGGSGERGEQGLPGIGFKLTDDGNFDIDGKRLTDVSLPVDGGDATTKAYVDGEIGHHTGNFYHLRQSFTFYDSSGTKLALSTDNITGLVTDYKHGYYKIPKGGDDYNFSTLDIKIRNNLPQSTYSALFYLYGYRNNSIMSGVDLGPILFGVDGTNYNILKYDDDDTTETRNHTKGIIWFTSDGSAGSIELGLRFLDKSITHFVILSRCVEGKVNLGLSSNIVNVSSTVGDVTLYFENIVMNNRSIKNLGGPTDDGDVTNKKYVDTENAKQDTAINDKTSKKYVDDEMVKFSSIILGLGYNKNTRPAFDYIMNDLIHRSQKNVIFRGSASSSIAYTAGRTNNASLIIPNKGKYTIFFKDTVSNSGNLRITLTSGNVTRTIFQQYYNPSILQVVTLRRDLFVDNSDTILKIFSDGSLLLFGSQAIFSKGYFSLYLASDVLNQRAAANQYLKLDGSNKMGSDLDIDGNHILKVENLVDYKDTDPYDYRVKDVKSVVNKEYLNENFMKKVDKDGREYYDLKQLVIKNSAPHDAGSYDNDTLVSKAFVNAEIAKLPKPATDVLKLDGSRAMTGDLNLNNKVIKNCGRLNMVADGNSPINMNNSYLYGLPNPFRGDDAANKTYVDNRDNLNLPLNGSRAMQGNLNMSDHTITGIRNSAADNAALTVGGAKATFFPLQGNRSMQGNLNMANHSIINLKDPQPSDSSYAASVNFVNKTVNDSNVIINDIINKKIQESEERSIEAVQQENVFEKVMVDDLFILDDDDIKKVAVVNKEFHKVNQQTYQFKIDYDSSIGYYSTRLGVNVVYLPIGYYTIVFEMYFSDKIDQDKITINALSGTLSVSKINTKKSSDHTRSVINFYKAIIYPSDDELDIDITLKNKTGQSYDADTQIYVVVYGVVGTQNDVDTRLWDRYFYVDDKKIYFEASIDMVNKDIENVNNLSINNELNMNNREIKNLGDGNENSDAVNVKQLNEMETNITNYVTGEFGKVNPVLKNNSDLIKFIYRNLIRNDSKLFLIKELYFPDSIRGRTQNNYTYQTNGDNKGDVTFYLAYVHKATTSDNMMIALHWESGSPPIQPIYIFVSKDKVVASRNPLINEPSLKSYNIPSYYQGKQLYLWITIQADLIVINFSGTRAITVTHRIIQFNRDTNLRRIDVSDSPFTIQRGLITKNIYNVNSDAYKDVREYEISEGTFVSAV